MILGLRSLAFHLAFFTTSLFMGILGLPALAGPRHWSQAVGTVWSRIVLWLARCLVGIDYRLEGTLPDGPILIASKHQSAFETLLFPAIRPDAVFVLKKELLHVPLVGWYLARSRQIAIDRAASASALRRMLTAARQRAAEGLSIVIFPEGTRVPVGVRAPFRPGVAALYGHLSLPVVPVTLDSGRYWARRSFLLRPGTIRVRFAAPIPPGLKRREFEEKLKEALSEPLEPAEGKSGCE